MRKRLISFALAATIMVSASLPAFATKKFDMSVFDGRNDLSITSDDMTGQTSVFPKFFTPAENVTYVSFDDDSRAVVDSYLWLTDSYDYYYLNFTHLGPSSTGLNSIIVKIGDNRYAFSNCTTETIPLNNGMFFEVLRIPMKKEVVPFMNDFSEHWNEEIKVRYIGSSQSFEFSLTAEMKYDLLAMYDFYVVGNGTRNKNLRDITDLDRTIVSKNGEIIDGHRDEKILRTVLEGVVESLDTLSTH